MHNYPRPAAVPELGDDYEQFFLENSDLAPIQKKPVRVPVYKSEKVVGKVQKMVRDPEEVPYWDDNQVTLQQMFRIRYERVMGCAPRKRVWNRVMKKTKLEFHHMDDFTVCILRRKGKNFVGVAKRNPKDQVNPEHGERTAYSRMLNHLLESDIPELD